MSKIYILIISCVIALRGMLQYLIDDWLKMVQITSHYLSHCWPRSMPSNGIIRPQWVNNQKRYPMPCPHGHAMGVSIMKNIVLAMTTWSYCTDHRDGCPGTHFTNASGAHEWNLMKLLFLSLNCYSYDSSRSQICTCHDSSAVVACAKLWPDQVIIFHITVTYIFTRFG